jgi:D-glycero-D-manno-heptose 1,7-bisphosphate phosphatase
MSKALFLDRDGTLIFDRHFLADPAGVELIPGAAEALRRAQSLGYKLFLHTNQSGVGRGLHSMEDVHRCNVRMEELIGLPRPLFTEICIAPEKPEDPSLYRKPSPRFILESVEKHGLDRAHCWMVGDREADVQAGLRAGIQAAALCSGKNDADGWATLGIPGILVFPNLAEFVSTLGSGEE